MIPNGEFRNKKRFLLKDKMMFAIGFLAFLFIIMTVDSTLALRNPAAVYCKALGYEYMIFYEKGGARGACMLPNNPVDAWDFLKGKVGREYSYCIKQGYEIKTIVDSDKCKSTFSDECAVCIKEDASEEEVTELMALNFTETVCGDSTCGLPENFSSCPEDCPAGGWDDYCDGLDDGKCDPDCKERKGPDPDCVDTDGDGEPDIEENCPKDPGKTEPGICGCGVADADSDGDGTADCIDNCPTEANSDQKDQDGDGVGDACDNTPSGINANNGGNNGGNGDNGGGNGGGFCFIECLIRGTYR